MRVKACLLHGSRRRDCNNEVERKWLHTGTTQCEIRWVVLKILQGGKQNGLYSMQGRVREGSKERNKHVLGAKINRSLPDFKGLTTKLWN